MNQAKPRRYEFTLTLDGAEELTFEMMDRLFEMGCDDATFGTRCGVPFATFHREAASPTEAILSAIEAIERADLGLRVVRIEPDELVTVGAIAARAGRVPGPGRGLAAEVAALSLVRGGRLARSSPGRIEPA